MRVAGPLALLALTGYALLAVFDQLQAGWNVVLWLAGAVVLHDLVLFPVYAAVGGRLPNWVRIPAGLSLLLALVFVGTVAGKGSNAFRNASGHPYAGYLGRWLAVTAVLFALGALTRASGRGRSPRPPAPPG